MTGETRTYRFHVAHLAAGAEQVDLTGGEAHHLRDVLRLGQGGAVELFDGRGALARGRIAALSRKAVRVEIEGLSRVSRSGARVHLAFAMPKGKRLDWLLEKATELGAASLRAVTFERSVRQQSQFSDAVRQRWLGHCVSAAKQCGLNFLPELREPLGLVELLGNAREGAWIVGDMGQDASTMGQALSAAPADVTVLVGPEGGLAPAEFSAAVEAGLVPVRLGHTTLRTETAAVALLAGVSACLD